MTGKFWPALFGAAALYNFTAGLPPLLIPALSAENLGLPPYDPQHIIIAQLAGMLICLFGIGYAMVAMGTPGGREIVVLGMIGKLGVVLIVTGHLLWGHVPLGLVAAAGGDFLFALAFIAYLRKGRTSPFPA
jgi:hypothetical protein